MVDINGLSHDPADHERVIGWGVYRPAPWHLVGVFPVEHMARQRAEKYGGGYIVAWGTYLPGSQDFRAVTDDV